MVSSGQTPAMDQLVYSRSAQLMEAELHEELVALDPVAGRCFGFNDVAATVWKLLAQPKSFEQLREALMNEFEVAGDQCSIELRDLLDQLRELGLVRVAE